MMISEFVTLCFKRGLTAKKMVAMGSYRVFKGSKFLRGFDVQGNFMANQSDVINWFNLYDAGTFG